MAESSEAAAHRIADDIEASLRAFGTPERAEGQKKYLKIDLHVIGATVPQTRAALRRTLNDTPALDRATLEALVEDLWSRGIFECRLAAVEVLSGSTDSLDHDDLPWLQRLIRESRTWALIDVLSASVVGSLVERHPGRTGEALDQWAGHDDFWLRRAALLAELGRARSGDEASFRRFAARADPMLVEKEFFIRKAIGWVLREAGKTQPETVVAWLQPRASRASGVTMREAVKYLPEADAARLMEAYRQR